MSKFDTHGGYFAPKDYLKVNEGGSHEENPNGGVQIGVDPEGNPNLLEEGEPVYKDYVYSDNITAEKEFLEQNNLPGKYDGKLYSKIADDILSEAEERPLDPISRNGLEALLGRLADAQEEQKQRDQQRELEDELANLSPEELDQLEAMLAQQEQMPQEQVQPEIMGSAEPVQQPMPIMRCGGTLLKKFDMGGDLDEDELNRRIEEERNKRLISTQKHAEEKEAQRDLSRAQWKTLFNLFTIRPEDKYLENAVNELNGMKNAYISGKRINGGIGEEEAIDRQQRRVERIEERNRKMHERLDESMSEMNDAQKRLNALRFPFAQSFVPVEDEEDLVVSEPKDTLMVQAPIDTVAVSSAVPADSVVTAPKAITEDSWDAGDLVNPFVFKNGGQVNRFDEGGWERLLNALRNYKISLNPGGISGTYAIDTRFPLGTEFKNIKELEDSEAYRKFTNYILANSERQDVLDYLRLLDERTAPGITKLFDNGILRDDWKDLYNRRRYDQKGGIYHISGNIDNLSPRRIEAVSAEPAVSVQNPQMAATVPAGFVPPIVNSRLTGLNSGLMYDWMLNNPTGGAYRPKPEEEPTLYPGYTMTLNGLKANTGSTPMPSGSDEDVDENPYGYSPLPTWPRYAGAIGSGLLGLYNVFQSPDKYRQRQLQPYLPEGRIHLQNQVYNPIDQNMVANSIIAQGNATNRSLRNSGLGPSAGAAILASDNNTTGNLGTGFIQAWDANNQRRNAVIAANNQAEAQRANFDWTVDAARKKILNDTAYYNGYLYNDLNLQRLNYGAEGDKYNAISNQISNGLQALSGIGKENFAMNQVNTNPAFLGYGVGANGAMFYNPRTGRWEIKEKK